LKKALDSLAAQRFEPSQREIIVILNACTDDSRAMIDSHFKGLPGLSVVDEPVPGLSVARNTGLHVARSPLIAFLDDDAIAPPTWLASLMKSLGPDRLDVAAAGGPVRPIWEGPRPRWLPASLEIFLTIVDHGPDETSLGPYKYIVGANMAYRTELLKSIGGFTRHLDRVGGMLLSNGDLLPQDLLRSRGYKVLYNPSAFVDHHVSAKRLSPEWFWERGYWQGYSDCVMALHVGRHKKLPRARRVCRSVVGLLSHPAALVSLFGRPDPAKVEAQYKGRWLLGYLSASVRPAVSVTVAE
jgi:cellulose synthase/poly-beta-1,6-N-acetylglucosamine synthase-like glycosyltransferase